MYDQEEASEHMMRTRKKRRNYKSLEDGKEDSALPEHVPSSPLHSKHQKAAKDHIISIDTHSYKQGEKAVSKADKSSNSKEGDNSRSCGRWTSEEHKKFIEALKKYGKQWKKVEEYIAT